MRRLLVTFVTMPANLGERLVSLVRRHLSYANVAATLALLVVLSGTAYAAVALPRNSVKAKQIDEGAVGSSEVKDGSLKTRDFSSKARKALEGPRGPAGPAGPPGPAGPGGPGGGGGVAALLTYKTAAGTVAAAPIDGSTEAVVTARCDTGQRVTGGGVRLQAAEDLEVSDSYPEAAGIGWTGRVENDGQTARTFTVFAVCVP